MRTLYHFRHSPFSRRVRLALAHKELDCELREGRENPRWVAEARRLVPLQTMPVLQDGDRVLGDSTAITRYLDAAYPTGGRIWPEGDDLVDVLRATTLVDVVLDSVVYLGTRYFALRDHPSWPTVKDEALGRARGAAEGLAGLLGELAGRSTIAPSGWSAADMWLFTLTIWFEGLPARAASGGGAAQVHSLGFSLPSALSTWADAHRGRAEVVTL